MTIILITLAALAGFALLGFIGGRLAKAHVKMACLQRQRERSQSQRLQAGVVPQASARARAAHRAGSGAPITGH